MKPSNKKNPKNRLFHTLRGEMPAEAKANLCVFSHFSRDQRVAEHVYYYLNCLAQAGCDIVFVSTSDELTDEHLERLQSVCAVVVVRKNYGYDFGSYKCGLDLAGDHLQAYQRVVLANDSVYGPFHDISELIEYGDHHDLDMWGATDSFAVRYHIQSYFIVYNRKVFLDPAFHAFWDTVRYDRTASKLKKQQIIDNYEVGGSTHFVDALFRLGAMCSNAAVRRYIVDAVKTRLADEPALHRFLLANANVRHNSTHLYWDILIKHFRYPFIKRELLQVNPVQMIIADWDTLIASVSDYDVNLIAQHLIDTTGDRKPEAFSWLFEPTTTPSGIELPFFLTQLLTIWPDLEQKLNVGVETEEAVLNSIAYWEHPERKNAPDIEWPANNQFPDIVYEPASGIVQDTVLPITQGALAAWRTRPDIQAIDLNTFIGRQQFIYWQLSLGQQEYRYLAPTDKDIAFLLAPCQRFGGTLSFLPNLALLLPVFHALQPHIVKQLEDGDVAAYTLWWKEKEPELMALIHGRRVHPVLPQARLKPGRPRGTYKPNGINVVGMPNGQFGVGEDARTATRALLRAGFETTVWAAPIGVTSTVFKPEWTDDFLQDDPVAKTNLICLPAADTYQLVLKWSSVLAGRYNICAWQWELPVWPRQWAQLLKLPDEIWAQSKYVADMFSRATDKPVTYMPLSVDKPMFTPRSKTYFGIPEGAFTFLSVFDCNSWIKRKNPMGAVKAFAKAFPAQRSDVRLVVKVMNSQANSPDYQELLAQVARDPRIILIDKFLPRNDMLALIDACDVFVSLHRSEGFGRVIAEAMYIGKPVISTNFSGSVDFAFEGTAYTVDGPLVPLQRGDYVDHENQYWMDPDLDAAAEAYRSCVDDAEKTRTIALAGQRQIADNHTIFAIAVRYHRRLKELGIN